MRKSAKPTPFEVLGVTPADDYATIRRAWKKLVKENHPDLNGQDKDAATARLTALNAAFDRLRNHAPLRTYRGQPQKPTACQAEPKKHPIRHQEPQPKTAKRPNVHTSAQAEAQSQGKETKIEATAWVDARTLSPHERRASAKAHRAFDDTKKLGGLARRARLDSAA